MQVAKNSHIIYKEDLSLWGEGDVLLTNSMVECKRISIHECDVALQEDIDLTKCTEANISACCIRMQRHTLFGGVLRDNVVMP